MSIEQDKMSASTFKSLWDPKNHGYNLKYHRRQGDQYEFFFEGLSFDEEIYLEGNTFRSDLRSVTIKFKDCVFRTLKVDSLNCLKLEILSSSIGNFELGSVRINEASIDDKSSVDLLKLSRSVQQGPPSRMDMKVFGLVDTIQIDDQPDSLNFELSSVVNKILASGAKGLSIVSASYINECVLKSSNYPFSEHVAIRKLVVENCFLDGTIKGIFQNIEIRQARLKILKFESLICLDSIKISRTSAENPNAEVIFQDIYIGGTLTLLGLNSSIYFRLFYLKEIGVIHSLHIDRCKSSVEFIRHPSAKPYRVNNLTLSNMNFGKDISLLLTNIICQNFNFYEFKSQSLSRFDNIRKGSFDAISHSFDELSDFSFEKNRELIEEKINQSVPTDIASELRLENTDLGPITFVNTDLSGFEMEFHSSKMNEIFLAGSKMPTIIKSTKDEKQDFHQVQSANMQLKKVCQQNGDVLGSNIYFSNEMNAYYTNLEFKGNFAEKLSVFLNKISSNHGLSIGLSFWTTIITSIILYMCFCFSLGITIDVDFSPQSWDLFWVLVSYFSEFLNPIHKLDNLSDLNLSEQFTPVTRIIDALSRIIIGYLLYQFIAAFRKHGKSK